MDVDEEDIYTYESNPMRQGFVRNEINRIDEGRRPPPPQQPRLFGLSPSPISGQPTFQPRPTDTGYEPPASRVDEPEQRPINIDNLFNDIAGFVQANIGRNPNINNDLSALYTEFLRQNTDGSYESMQDLHKQVNKKSRQHPFNFSNRNGQFYVVGAGLKKALKKKTKK
jgi:hypothetical protein